MGLFDWFNSDASKAAARQADERAERMQACNALMEAQDKEIDIIEDALAGCFDEEEVVDKATISKEGIIFFKSEESVLEANKDIETRKTLLGALNKLLGSYPALDDGELTTAVLDGFYAEREKHHSRVMEIVETYLPQVHSQIKMQFEHAEVVVGFN